MVSTRQISTEITLTLRYDFGSVSIDLSAHPNEIKEKWLPDGKITYIHMRQRAAQKLVDELRELSEGVSSQLSIIERKIQLIHPTFQLRDVAANQDSTFIIKLED